MLIDIPEKQWHVLNHKIIFLVVVFACGGDIFMNISKFWIQSNLKNRLYDPKIFEKLVWNVSEASTSNVW